ncbi:MAG: hypothetical protein FJ387_29620 [Verrucomicrobia bacterium]|nr:hypothetical protein [Verrucomicrobiota bacterium]
MKMSFLRRRLVAVLTLLLAAVGHAAMAGDVNPVLIGSWPQPASGVARAVAVAGDYAYLADGNLGLQVIDVRNPAHPVSIGAYDTSGFADDVAVSGNFAYVADREAGLQVIDVSDPSHPQRVGGFSRAVWVWAVAVSGRYAYVADSRGLQVLDVSNPANPLPTGAAGPFGGTAIELAVSGSNALVLSDPGEGFGSVLVVVDVSNPAAPQRVGGYGHFLGELFGVAASGHHAFTTSWRSNTLSLQVLDVADPTHPQLVGGHELGTNVNVRRLTVSEHYLYVAVRSGPMGGVQVFDVSTPAKPRRVGGNSTFEGRHIAVRGEKIFMAAYGGEGLAIFEMPPFIKCITKDGPKVKLEWEGFGPARLQRATRLTNPDWQDLSGFEGTNTATLPANGGAEFFRLVRP